MSKQEVYNQLQRDLVFVTKCPLEIKQAKRLK